MKIEIFIAFFGGEKSMPALALRAGSKNQLINYDFGQKTREGPAPGVRIQQSNANKWKCSKIPP